MYRVFIFLVLIAVFWGCVEEKLVCDVKCPAEELPWLKAEIEQLETESNQELSSRFYISQAEYKGNTVFLLNNCCESCNTYIPVFNCSGEDIRMTEDISLTEDIEAIELFWVPENFACNL